MCIIATTQIDLTEREWEILRCLAWGLSIAETAAFLNLSVDWVKDIRYNLYSKLGVSTNLQALSKALLLGLLTTFDLAFPGWPDASRIAD